MIPSGTDIKLLFTTVSDLVKKGMTIEAQEKIMDLREFILEVREKCFDLQEENSLLKKKIAERDSVVFKDGAYWTKDETGHVDGPFCLPCHDNNGKLVRLKDSGRTYRCPVKVCGYYHRYVPESTEPRMGVADTVAGY